MIFDVMQSAPLRVAMDAPWPTWPEAIAEDIERFLQGWKTSMIPLKRMGYGSLVKVLTMCWYSQPETFISSGYPGMPKRELLTDQPIAAADRSEEHTSELQSRPHLVCRLLLEKKKKK